MTDAGEKLAERIAKFSPQHALCEYEDNGLCEHCVAELLRAELERAAEECDQARVSLMCRSSVSMSISETVELLEYLIAAIRKLKE